MPTTLDLLDKALESGDSAREISRMLKLGSSTLSVARHRGRLSPAAAGRLAAHLGMDPVPWVALAALEAEPPTSQHASLTSRVLSAVGKSLNQLHGVAASFVLGVVAAAALAGTPTTSQARTPSSDNGQARQCISRSRRKWSFA